MPDLDGAIDVDLSITPFTNKLPIRRPDLFEGQRADTRAVYLRFPDLSVTIDRQRYTCLKRGRQHRYESSDSDFIRDIDIDADGLVVTYPGLFKGFYDGDRSPGTTFRVTLNARAWLAFVVASVLTSVYLMRKDPALLARRMRGGPMFEKEGTQRIIMTFTSLGFIAIHVIPGLDHRFGRSVVPVWAVVLGDLLVAIGFVLIFVVSRENTYTAALVIFCALFIEFADAVHASAPPTSL